MVLFAVQNPLSLIWSHLFIFAFVSCSLDDSQMKYCYYLFQSFISMFNSRSFMVYLILRSLTHFEVYLFIFLDMVLDSVLISHLHVAVQFSQHNLLKRLSYLHCIFLPDLSLINYPLLCGFISGLSVLFCVYFCANTMVFWLL